MASKKRVILVSREARDRRDPGHDAYAEVLHEIVPQSEHLVASLDLTNTPRRVMAALRDMLRSYQPGAREELVRAFRLFPSDGQDAMVTVGPIDFTSLCAHHVLPFTGRGWVGYVPGDSLIGLSKIPRVVEYYARMLQNQERMARQVADFICEKAEAKLVIVMLEAAHECMRCRGVKQRNTRMVTTAVRPAPNERDEAWRGIADEFYAQVGLLKGGA